jgi:hypothetical protein
LYSLGCKSYTGYKVLDFTTSGMTHTIPNIVDIGSKFISAMTNDLYEESPAFADFNFGLLKINRKTSS